MKALLLLIAKSTIIFLFVSYHFVYSLMIIQLEKSSISLFFSLLFSYVVNDTHFFFFISYIFDYSPRQKFKRNEFLIFFYDAKCLIQIRRLILIANEMLYLTHHMLEFHQGVIGGRQEKGYKTLKTEFATLSTLCENWFSMIPSERA